MNRCVQLSAPLRLSLTWMKFVFVLSCYRVMEFGLHVGLRSVYSCEWRKVDSCRIWHREVVSVGSGLPTAKEEL